MAQDNNKIYWVKGNTCPLLIPLEQEVMTPNEEIVREPYYPVEGAVVKVILETTFKKHEYTPTVNGNLLTFTDAGKLPCGCYDVVVTVDNPDGSHLRSKWNHQIVVTDDNVRTLQEWDEFKEQDVEARAAVFFFAKGDPFTYEDFTPEEIADLKKPATDAAAEVAELERTIEGHEATRQENEQGRVEAEGLRSQAEQTRQENEGTRQENEGVRQENEQTRQHDEGERDLAEQQRADTFAGYERRMETMEGKVSDMESAVAGMQESKLDKITEEAFYEIFN